MSDAIEQSKVDLLDPYEKLARDYLPDQIYNTDQVGVEKELHSTRCPSLQGEKNLRRRAKQKRHHALLHHPAYDFARWKTRRIYLSVSSRTGW